MLYNHCLREILAEKWSQNVHETALSKHHQVQLYFCFIVSNPLIITVLCDILQLDNVTHLHIVSLNIHYRARFLMLRKTVATIVDYNYYYCIITRVLFHFTFSATI